MPGAMATAVIGSQIVGGMFSAAQGRAQQQVLNQQAQQERIAAELEAGDFRRQTSRAIASSIAQQGRSGIVQNMGSPLAVTEDFAGESERQVQRILRGGGLRATRLEQEGRLAKSQGMAGFFGGLGRAGATFLNPTVQRRFGFNPSGVDLTPQFGS